MDTDEKRSDESGDVADKPRTCDVQMISVDVRDNHVRELKYKPPDSYNAWDRLVRMDGGAARHGEEDGDCDTKESAVVHLFGRDDLGRSTCLLVKGFRPWLYLRLPDGFARNLVDNLARQLCARAHVDSGAVTVESVRRSHFKHWECADDGPTSSSTAASSSSTPAPRSHAYLKISCRTVGLRRRITWMLKKAHQDFLDRKSNGLFCDRTADPSCYTVHEHKFEPWQQFLAEAGLQASGWLRFDESRARVGEERVTSCARELWIDAADVRAVSDRADIAPFVVCSFDIECYTPDDRFPVPTVPEHRVVQIGCVTWAFGRPYEQRKVRVLCLSETDASPPLVTPDCPKEPELAKPCAVETTTHATELDLIAAFVRHVVDVDADLVVGYNTDQFDWRFLGERSFALGGPSAARKMRLSRVLLDDAYMNVRVVGSKQKGFAEVYFPEMNGRVGFDMLPKFRDDMRMRTYSLDDVSAKFLGAKKAGLVASQIFAKWRSGPAGRAVVAHYCAQDCDLTLRLLRRTCALQGVVEMSRATGTPAECIVHEGEQVRFVTQVYLACHGANLVVNDINEAGRDDPAHAETTDGYQGAEVLEPKRGFYLDPVATLDFNSLYPSIMMCHNLCPSRIIVTEEQRAAATARGLNVATFVVEGETYHFVQDAPGVLPLLLKNLLRKRGDAKKLMEAAAAAGDDEKEAIYNARQLALKVSANSVYGSMGCTKGKLYLKAIAASVTKIGRDGLMATREFVLSRMSAAFVYGDERARALWGDAAASTFADVLYGDTDSVMIRVPTHPRFEGDPLPVAFEASQRMAALITAELYRPPMKLAFEKVYRPFALFAKKVYAGIKYERPDAPNMRDGQPSIEVKGMRSGRRDTVPFVARLEVEMLRCAMVHASADTALACLDAALDRVRKGDVDYQDFSITKRVKALAEYEGSNPLAVAQVVLNAKMRERSPGSEYAVGDRASFVFVRAKRGDHFRADQAEDPAFAKDQGLQLDVPYYLESHFRIAVVRILDMLFPGRGLSIFKSRGERLVGAMAGQRTLFEMGNLSEPLPPTCTARAPPPPVSQPAAARKADALVTPFLLGGDGRPVRVPAPPPKGAVKKRKSPPKPTADALAKKKREVGTMSAFLVTKK